MKFCKFHNFPWILLYFLCIYCYLCQCKETVFHVKISEIRHILKTDKGCVFPPVFAFEINNQNGSTIKLSLSKNEDIHHDSPVYVFRNNKHGHVTLMKQHLTPIQDVAYYQDTTNTASIAVTCVQSDDVQFYPQLTGTFVYDRKEFLLTPVVPSPSINKHSNIYRLTQTDHHYHPYSHDYRTLPGFDVYSYLQHDATSLTKTRHRRQINIKRPYIIDVLVVVDYQIYQDWLKRARGATAEKRDEFAKRELKRYFSHFINGVDMRYRKIPNPELSFQVKLTGFIIADTEIAYPWTELRKESSTPRNLLDADVALKDFRSWINDTGNIPPHDHAMLFTGYNLYTLSENNTKLLHTAGLAFIGSMCRRNGDSVSIVEDHGGFQNVATAAHELGHSLGALHDGEKNSCDSHQRYIMAASGYGPVPPEVRHNQWYFSNCSLNYFRNFTSNLARYGYTCLTETYSGVGIVEKTEMPGQLYSADEQCRLIWGPQSYLCRGAEFGNASSLCTAMYCRDPNTVNDCVLHTAARGTSCGDRQWCVDGDCIYSPRAPEKQDDCILGDQPGIAFIGKTCAELIEETPAYCYQPKVKARCCGSCQNKYTWKLGCEYGDRVKGCQPWHCNTVSNKANILSECCGACMIGAQIQTTAKPEMIGTPVTMTPDLTPPTTCRDKVLVNGQKCENFVDTNGHHLCYEDRIQTFCCETCNAFKRKGFDHCPYGDRSPTLCKQFSNLTSSFCDLNKDNCCETCNVEPPNSAETLKIGLSILASSLLLLIL